MGSVDEGKVRQVFLDELGQGGALERVRAGIWKRAGTVKIRRQWPLATKAGKILPFHLMTG